MKKHGMKDMIDFQDEEIEQLRKYFSSLDRDGSGKVDFLWNFRIDWCR